MNRLLIGAVALLAAASASAETLTLRQAAEEALARNPAISAANAGRSAAQAGLREARSAWLPRVDASDTLMRSNNPVFVFGSLLEQGRFGPQNFDPVFLNDPDALTNNRLAVNVRYAVFDQFRRLNATEQAANAVTQAGFASEEAQQRLRVETISRYYGMLLAEKKRDVAAEAVRSAEADATAMRLRTEQGLLVESELLASEVQLASFRQRLIEAEGDVAVAGSALATLLQRPTSAPIEVSGDIPAGPEPALSLEESIARAHENRGDVNRAKNAAASAELQIKTARGALLPRADAFASWGASRGNPDHALGIVVGVDLFDGAKYARIAAARAALEAARAAETAARDQVTMEVVSAYYRARAARQRIDVASKSTEQAAEAARIVHDRYEQGLTTITEQLRAQTALVTARLELLAARYDYAVGTAELLRATGGLNDVEAFD